MNLSELIAYLAAAGAAVYFLAVPITRRHTLPRWLFAIGMLVFAAESLLLGLTFDERNIESALRLHQLRLVCITLIPGIWLCFAAVYSRGDAKKALKRRLPILIPAFIAPVAVVFLYFDHLLRVSGVFTSDGVRWVIQLFWPGYLLHLSLLLGSIGTLVGLERTYRAAVGTMRWKIKFMLFGLGFLFSVRFFTSSQAVLVQEIPASMEVVNSAALLISALLIGRSLVRRGSFEIDLYPSQSVLSNSVTIILAGAYLTIIGVLTKLLPWFGEEGNFAVKTFLILVAIVALGITLQSDRFRQRVRQFVSRNFQRPLYDYRTLWLQVTEATTTSVDRKTICQSTTRLLSQLFDAKLASIWLLDEDKSRFVLASSTDLGAQQDIDNESISIEAPEAATRLANDHADPFDLDQRPGAWLEPLRQANPSSFKMGGNRACIPMIGRDRLVGLIVLGDRNVSRVFSQQEFDTLKCIATHLASTLLSAQLSRELAQAREVEAFQTMATFFVHDLKNAVSTLNLMLKNMPLHWDNPEFREDALRGIGRTSDRISDLITKLSQVRSELQIQKSPISLRKLLDTTLAQWQCPDRIQFEQNIAEAEAKLELDLEKAQSVLLNLLINAAEAIPGDGEIKLATRSSGNWITITVEDDGPGMSEDFLRNSLFKPFKTTKKGGLGIGMFQSKMIMEAHGGSIHAASEEGKGARFTLRFPRVEVAHLNG